MGEHFQPIEMRPLNQLATVPEAWFALPLQKGATRHYWPTRQHPDPLLPRFYSFPKLGLSQKQAAYLMRGSVPRRILSVHKHQFQAD